MKIESNDEDTELYMMITACRKELEQYLGISIVPKEITVVGDVSREFDLPYGPVVSIDSVNKKTGEDANGLSVYDTLAADDYTRENGFFYPGYGRYVVVYTAGYIPQSVDSAYYGYNPPVLGAGYNVLPMDIKLQVLRLIAYRYEHRGDTEQVSISSIVGYANKNFSWI